MKNLPNKMYLNFGDISQERFDLEDYNEFLKNNDDITFSEVMVYDTDQAYIRKDALLEWAKEVKTEIEKQDKIGAISTGICKGAIWELEEIINKINLL